MDEARSAPLYDRLATRGMGALLLAQFLSAFADNALFIVAITLLRSGTHGELMASWLQQVFVVAFIVLAPFVGPLADSQPKSRVMLIGNGLKLLGAGGMAAGLHPLAAYLCVGIGAAIYSPAKYGLLGDFFGRSLLVKANGLLEASTIVAILGGVMMGGWWADVSIHGALWGILGLYAAAATVNLLIPSVPPSGTHRIVGCVGLLVDFGCALKRLWRDADGRFSLVGTSLFWGTGSALRLLMFAWVPFALAVHDAQTPALLMGVVSIGIVLGAALASFFVRLENVNRAMIGGLFLGPLILALAHIDSVRDAVILLALIGVAGGFFVVPLNALLQNRGHALVGTGHALAIQNLGENAAILLFIGAYILLQEASWTVSDTVTGFGGLLLSALLLLAVLRVRWRASATRERA